MVFSRSIFGAFRRYSSKINLIRAPVREESFSATRFYPNCSNVFKSIRTPIREESFSTARFCSSCSKPSFSESRFSRPIFSNSAIQSPFLNGAKRFYRADRDKQVKFPIKTMLFSIYVLITVTPEFFVNEYLETVPFSKRTHFVKASTMFEEKLGRKAYEEKVGVYRNKLMPSDHPDNIRVQRIAKNIIEALQRALEIEKGTKSGTQHLEGLVWEVIVVDDPECSAACALSGGKIFVYTELLRRLNSDDEVAFIIGHEVAHMVARHKAELVSKFSWLRIPLDRFFANFLPFGIIKDVTDLLTFPLVLRLEIEADYIGLVLMAHAGYDPQLVSGTLKKARACWDRYEIYVREIFLNRAKVRKEAMDIYRETIGESSV